MTERQAGVSREGLHVQLAAFDGPLDLLLHLVRVNEVDITNIPIVEIAAQYDAYLAMMRELDLEVAGEYLVMAATLLHIKSRLLLPPDPDLLAEDAGEDPRAELARRLAEYARYKEAAVELARRPILNRDVFAGAADRSELPEREGVLVVSLFSLLESMQRVLARIPAEQKHHTVSRVRLTLQECMVEVMDALRAADPASVRFEDLLTGGEPTRERVVLAFLSILELAKIQALLIFQNVSELGRPEGPIRVRLAVGALDMAEIAEAGARADADMDTREFEPREGDEGGEL